MEEKNVARREAFRQISYVRAACVKSIVGRGLQGYREAILFLAERLGKGGADK